MGTCSSLRRRMMKGGGEVSLPNYLCLTALESGTFTFTMDTGLSPSSYEYIAYSNDGGNSWVTTYNVASEQVTTTVNVTEGDSVLWRGYSPTGKQIGRSNVKSSCGYFGGTAKFNVSGCIVSLIKNKSFNGFEDMCIAVSSLFSGSRVVEVDEDLLPCKKLTLSYEYSQMFNGCTYLTKPPKLPATELGARNSYESMFLNCKAFSVAPELPAETLTTICYFNMFFGTSVTYVKMLAKTLGAQSLINWMRGVPNVATSIFVKHIDATWTTTGVNGVPTNWTVIYYDPSEDKYYTSQDKSQECDDHGNPI